MATGPPGFFSPEPPESDGQARVPRQGPEMHKSAQEAVDTVHVYSTGTPAARNQKTQTLKSLNSDTMYKKEEIK